MNTIYENDMAKIAIMSKFFIVLLALLLLFSVLLIPFLIYLVMSSATSEGPNLISNSLEISLDSDVITAGLLTAQDKLLLGIVAVIVSSIFISALVVGIKMLGCFTRRKLFSDLSVRYARTLVWLYLAWIGSYYGWMFLSPGIFNMPEMTIKLDVNDIFIVCLLWMFVWMLEVGRALQLDSELSI